jgi:O-antigen/teichoic acid export membrane protein
MDNHSQHVGEMLPSGAAPAEDKAQESVPAVTVAGEAPSLQRLSLRRNFSWTLAGNVVYVGCQWGMLMVLAKLGSPAMVGRFALGLAVCAPVLMFTNFQLRAVQATDAKDEYRFRDYVGLRILGTAVALAVIAGIAALAGYSREAALVVLLVGVAKSVESLSDVIYGLLQKHERMDRIAISMMIKGIGSLLALGALVALTHSVAWGVVGLCVMWTVVLVTYDAGNAARLLRLADASRWGAVSAALHGSRAFGRLGRLARLSLPLGVVGMLVSLNANIPRYFIEHYGGEAALGYFSAMAYLMVAGTMVVGALGQSATPRLARHYVEDLDAFTRLVWRLVALGTVLGLAALLAAGFFGREILTVLYRRDYAAHSDVLVWLMAAAAMGYLASMLGYAMTAARYFKVQAPVFALVVGVNVAACALLVPSRGLIGAAWAMVIALGVQLLSAAAVTAHAVRAARRRREQ